MRTLLSAALLCFVLVGCNQSGPDAGNGGDPEKRRPVGCGPAPPPVEVGELIGMPEISVKAGEEVEYRVEFHNRQGDQNMGVVILPALRDGDIAGIELPEAPLTIPAVKVGKTGELKFKIKALPDAKPGVRTIELNADWRPNVGMIGDPQVQFVAVMPRRVVKSLTIKLTVLPGKPVKQPA